MNLTAQHGDEQADPSRRLLEAFALDEFQSDRISKAQGASVAGP